MKTFQQLPVHSFSNSTRQDVPQGRNNGASACWRTGSCSGTSAAVNNRRSWQATIGVLSLLIFWGLTSAASPTHAAGPIGIPRPPAPPSVPSLRPVFRPYFIPVEQVIPPDPFNGKATPLTDKEKADLARRWLHWRGQNGGATPLVAPSAPRNLSPITHPQLQRWVR